MALTPVAPPPAGALDAAALLRQAHGLLVLHELGRAAPLRQVIALLEALAEERGDAAVAAYGALYRSLVDRALAAGWDLAAGTTDGSNRPAQSLLAIAVAEAALVEETALSRWVEQAGAGLPAPLLAAAAADLRILQALVVGDALMSAPESPASTPPALPMVPALLAAPSSSVLSTLPALPAARVGAAAGLPLLERLLQAPDWGALAPDLMAHYVRTGAGPLAQHRAFRWLGAGDFGLRTSDVGLGVNATPVGFVPVPAPDSVRPSDLIGYQAERELLRRNTVHFLAGYPANNVLLYGDRGTGKSSSVKALLREQRRPDEPADLWPRLRIVEVPKARLADFPVLVELLRRRPQRFILFVDDLSFEQEETQYKDVKAMLEGGIEARPANVVVYATSNRRHLIREQFADRTTPDSEEVHAQDTVQEKLSFADRFGLTITFPSPDQAAYLAIVEGLAAQRHLPIERAALRARAIEWAAWHNGRSGRTARQFVDYLEGELGLHDGGRWMADSGGATADGSLP